MLSMKICIINTLYYPHQVGGAEKSVQSLAEQFFLLGNEVAVITLGKEESSHVLNGVNVWSLKIENTYWPFDKNNRRSYQKIVWHLKDIYNHKYDKKISTILSQFQPKVIMTNNLAGFSIRVWEIARKLNIRIVHTLRDYYLQCPKTTRYKNNSNCNQLCSDCNFLSIKKRKETSKVDCVVGISLSLIHI